MEKSKKGTVKTLYLINLEEWMENKIDENGINIEENVGHMKNDIVESIVKLLQN